MDKEKIIRRLEAISMMEYDEIIDADEIISAIDRAIDRLIADLREGKG